MINTSSLYNSIVSTGVFNCESKLEIYDTSGSTLIGTFTDKIKSFNTAHSLYNKGQMAIGSACSKELDIEFICTDSNGDAITIPKMAQVKMYARVESVDGLSVSEWIPQGVYYISTRTYDPSSKVMTIHCYDAMLKAEQIVYTSVTTWTNRSARLVAGDCAALMGVTIENPAAIPEYNIAAPPMNKSARQILQEIAIAAGGNFTIAYKMANNVQVVALRFVPIVPTNSGYDLGESGMEFSKGNRRDQISKVTIVVGYSANGDEIVSQAGTSTNEEYKTQLTIFTESSVTNQIATDLLAKFGSYQYQPYSVKQAYLNPACEIGDGITAYNTYSVIATMNTSADSLFVADISAPNDEEIEDEYPYKTEQEKTEQFKAQSNAKIEATQEAITLEVTRATEAEGTLSGNISVQAGRIDLVVDGSGSSASIKIDAIVDDINESGSSIMINADKIQMTGTTTFLTANDVGPAGSTVIDGGRITTGTLNADRIVAGTLTADKINCGGKSLGTASSSLKNLWLADTNSSSGETKTYTTNLLSNKVQYSVTGAGTVEASWADIIYMASSGGTAKFG